MAATPVLANTIATSNVQNHTHEYTMFNDVHRNEKNADDNKTGIKADMPNLIKLPKDFSIGVEGGKDMLDTDAKHGWFGFLKITWNGTLLDLE